MQSVVLFLVTGLNKGHRCPAAIFESRADAPMPIGGEKIRPETGRLLWFLTAPPHRHTEATDELSSGRGNHDSGR